MAAAGLWATAADLARFCLAIAASYTGTPGALLAQGTAREMLTGQAPAPGMGLGPLLSTSGPLVFSHNGGQFAGFMCSMACTADGSLGAVAMTNSGEGMQVAEELVRRVGATRGVELPPAADWRLTADGEEPPANAGEILPGTYALDGITVTVEETGDELVVRFGPQPPCAFARTSGCWRAPELDTTVRFEDETLIVRQYGRELTARRTSPPPTAARASA
jgi:hypothetical protein